jgi:hypothetical protein
MGFPQTKRAISSPAIKVGLSFYDLPDREIAGKVWYDESRSRQKISTLSGGIDPTCDHSIHQARTEVEPWKEKNYAY